MVESLLDLTGLSDQESKSQAEWIKIGEHEAKTNTSLAYCSAHSPNYPMHHWICTRLEQHIGPHTAFAVYGETRFITLWE